MTASEQSVAAPPQLSPDGHWWWDGTAWIPAAERPGAAQPVLHEPAETAAPAAATPVLPAQPRQGTILGGPMANVQRPEPVAPAVPEPTPVPWAPGAEATATDAPATPAADVPPIDDFFAGPVAPQVPQLGHAQAHVPGWPPLATAGYPAQPGYGPPAYGAPGYGAPAYGPPAYGAPAYGAPGYGPPAPTGRSWVAITALVLGILPTWPAAVIVGLCGLAHVKRTGKQGRNLAIAGIVLGLVWLAGFVAWEFLDGKKEYDKLAKGDCIAADADLSGLIIDVPTVACSKLHTMEVFATYEDAGAERPTIASVQVDCGLRLGDYLTAALADPSLRLGAIVPQPQSWARGERTVVCMVQGSPRTGSLADSGRPS